ncbi:hypothetical protein PoB_007419200 [Plakobranchus ocellatus]|uniref:Uncharacterized protein n=1 Tax=Plakobranchus ocellatus TaxID=259542 RepID=A0AAV4DTN5_9GAST|nr:hypothetical protein PoB_007419200 [Plakobranchus ocellatus]
MHQPKPKSAPARIRSKFVKNRTNAMKEIEAWIRKDGEAFPVPEASRMSGQLTDNVTEERMLKAKLWELSKERYKFLSQNSYEQKVFSDRQQKKASLRRVASASWDARSKVASKGAMGSLTGLGNEESIPGKLDTPRHSSLTIETSGEITPLPKRSRTKNARFSLLDRLDPTKKRPSRSKSSDAKFFGGSDSAISSSDIKAEDADVKLKSGKPQFMKTDSASRIGSDVASSATDNRAKHFSFQPRPRTSHLPAGNARNKCLQKELSASDINEDERRAKSSVENRVGSAGTSFSKDLKSSVPTSPSRVKPTLSNGHHHDHHHRRHHQKHHHANQNQIIPEPALAECKENNRSNNSTTPSDACRTPTVTNRTDLSASKYGAAASESMTLDPRYARLEKTLCPLVRSKTTGDIGDIVNQIEALHVRPRRRPPDAKKTKIELKAFEYMKDKGFAF